jgi:hypothetical protein
MTIAQVGGPTDPWWTWMRPDGPEPDVLLPDPNVPGFVGLLAVGDALATLVDAVYIDGVKCDEVVRLNDLEGWADVFYCDPIEGEFARNGDMLDTVRRYGRIDIEWAEPPPQHLNCRCVIQTT